MRLFIHKIILLNILLFNKNLVNCNTQEYIPSMLTEMRDNERRGSQSSDLYIYNFDGIGSSELITIPGSFARNNPKEPLTREYVYKVNEPQQYKLLYPNKVEKIKFFDYVMEFDDSAMLPGENIEYIQIFTCKHNNPLLAYMYCGSKYYFYSFKPKTNKWNNYDISHDERFSPIADDNGVFCYEKVARDSLNELSTRNFQNYKDEEKEILRDMCNDVYCAEVNTKIDNCLEIYMKTPKVIVPNSVFMANYQTRPITRTFVYSIYRSQQFKLIHPNQIDNIKFKNYTMKFDEKAVLPRFKVEYMYIITCVHFHPVLMYLTDRRDHYYYNLDPETNTWKNYRLQFNTKFTEFYGIGNVYYYKTLHIGKNSFNMADLMEASNLLNGFCNPNRCKTKNIDNSNEVEITMK